MARYIKQELPDLRKTGEKKAYYRLKTERNIDFNQFIELISSHNSGISRGEAFHVLTHATDTLAELLAEGYSVTIDEMGKLNARSLRVDGVNFQADKRLIANVDIRCNLERAGVSRLCRSPFSKEERLQKALEYLNAHGAMKVKDYMEFSGLSHSVAAKELCGFEHDAASGISSIGRLAGKVYVRRMEE